MEQLNAIIKIITDNKDSNILLEISLDTDLRVDLDFDSLDLAELTVRCEHAFGVDIFDDGIVTTIKEIMEKISG
ncbi:MAG: acyl carrier protein [Candidatus Cloacimonetes bacterium]|nr:acyl carrier protein [Candidatus Cloacimonadota bacterium]